MKKLFASGKALKRTGLTLFVIGLVMGMIFRFIPEQDWNETLVFLSFLPLFMILGGAFLFFRGRQYATRASAESILSDGKPDVLYLRPFKSDASTAGQTFSAVLTPTILMGLSTEEEQLAEALKPFGDLVAINQPGKSLPTPGGAKISVADGDWQRVVIEQMQAARLVVIRAGDAPGILWELGKAREILEPGKVLVLVMAMSNKKYDAFRKNAEDRFGASLPERREMKKHGGRVGFFRFSADWTPEFLPLRAPKLRRSPYKQFRVLFKYALRPVFADHGIYWQEPPVSKFMVGSMIILLLFALLVMAAIVSALI